MKKWKQEIDLWSSMPDGTRVWARLTEHKSWSLNKYSNWDEETLYVVDDENAEIIKQWYDDKSKIEYSFQNGSSWYGTTCTTIESIRANIQTGHKYRIKPKDVYYYIWEKLKVDGGISISNPISDNHAESFGYTSDGWRKIESSKRIWDD